MLFIFQSETRLSTLLNWYHTKEEQFSSKTSLKKIDAEKAPYVIELLGSYLNILIKKQLVLYR